tara:strand:+ start:864 stop:1199 length:336 start_codon:yes stop_codon:yes gene_type:complete
MASLTGRAIHTSYKDLMTVAGSTEGEGIEATLKQIFDGNGDGTAMSLSSSQLGIRGDINLDGISSYVFKKASDTQFTINSEGVVVLKEFSSAPTAVEGGMYFDGTHFYVGI